MTQQLENIINIICQSFPEADSNYTFNIRKYPSLRMLIYVGKWKSLNNW